MSNIDENNLTTEYLYSDPSVREDPVVSEKGTGAYRFLAVIFLLLSICGLFIGMLGAVWAPFTHAQLFYAQNLENPGSVSTFSLSIMGMMVSIFNSFTQIQEVLQNLSLSGTIWFVTDLGLVFLAGLAVVLALVLMIVSFCTKSKLLARKCAVTSGVVLFLAYGGLFLISFLRLPFSLGLVSGVDLPAAVVAGVTLLVLIVTAIARRKIMGLLSSLMLILTVICITMLNYPTASLTLYSSAMVFDLYGADLFLGISLSILVVMLAFNFVVSTIRLGAKRSFAFDAVRFMLQLLAVILTIVSFMVADPSIWTIFTEEGQTLATVLLLVCSIAAFVVAILASLLKKKDETAEIVVAEQQPAPQAYDPAYIRVSPYDTYAPYVQPVMMAQPQPVVIQQPQPVVVQQQVQPQPEPSHTHTNVYVQQPPEKDIPFTEFERRMQAIAHGEAYPAEASKSTAQQQPAEAEALRKARKPKRSNEEASTYVYEGAQYMYDPFIKTLTAQEKNEFGDLFIANIYGLHSYLPTYVIGGDNKTFFDRVFIYLGSYRHYISQGLLEKIYLYVSKL